MDFNPQEKKIEEDSLHKTIASADHIHRYPAKMTPKIASYFLRQVKEERDDGQNLRVFDPFCGSGTTLLVARAQGFDIAGSELLKVASLIAQAKLTRLDSEGISVLKEAKELDKEDITTPKTVESWENREIWFKDEVYSVLMGLRSWIHNYKGETVYPHLFTALSQTVWNVSAADPGIIVPTRSKKSPKAPSISPEKIISKFNRDISRIISAQGALDELGIPIGNPNIAVGDAKDRDSWQIDEFDVVLTSPPYGDGINYRRAVSLQRRFFGLEDQLDGDKITELMIGRKSHHVDLNLDILPEKERDAYWVKAVQENSERRLRSVLTYVQDMRQTLNALSEGIHPTGRAAFVLGNPEVAGQRVPLARTLYHLAQEEGWSLAREPIYDPIKKRRQTPIRRSSNKPIQKEYILEFAPD